MKTIMAKSPHESSFSFSRRYFHLKNKDNNQHHEEDHHQILTFNHPTPKHKHGIVSLSKLRSAIASLGKARSSRVVGTIFGHRRGHVHFSVQVEGNYAKPTFLLELAMPTTALVREMASGAARIALECDKSSKKKALVLQEEGIWRAYCNGKKYGVANRYECGDEEWRVLKAVGPITVGAGVLPAANGDEDQEEAGSEEVMFMRANFERVVASRDSEAFYMINPHGVGGPELSIFLLRA